MSRPPDLIHYSTYPTSIHLTTTHLPSTHPLSIYLRLSHLIWESYNMSDPKISTQPHLGIPLILANQFSTCPIQLLLCYIHFLSGYLCFCSGLLILVWVLSLSSLIYVLSWYLLIFHTPIYSFAIHLSVIFQYISLVETLHILSLNITYYLTVLKTMHTGAYNLLEGWVWLTQKGFGLSSYAVPLTQVRCLTRI
jgi:hypothetical protein